MLQDIYNSYLKCAQGLGDFQALSKTELANGYCDAEEAQDEIKRNQYYAALMLRYWFKVYSLYRESQSARLEIEDFTSWLAESLQIAFNYRSWRDPKNKLYNDPNGPDKVINRCIFSTRNRYYQHYNKDKRKVNYISDSLERQIDAFGDSATALVSNLVYDEKSPCDDIVELYIKQNKIIEALIIDMISFQDSLKKISPYKNKEGENIKTSYEFSERKIMDHLNNLNSNYLNYFINKYDIDIKLIDIAQNKIKKLSNTRLYAYIRKTLYDLRNNKEMLDLLCL